jgi:hypothetical protein
MKRITLLFLFILIFNNYSTAQNPYYIGFKGLFERNWLTNKGFDNLNGVLSSNGVASLKNIYGAGGFGLIIGRKNKKASFEFSFGSFTAIALNRDTTNSDIAKPSITGRYNKMLVITKLYEVPRWRVMAGAGLSFSTLNFTLSDLRPQTNTLSSLVNTPSLSPSLVYTNSNLAAKFEFLVGTDYRTKLIREQAGELSIGLRLGYGYQFYRDSRKSQWFVKETQNEIKNFPLIIMDNLSVQLNVSISFNLASPDKK